MYAHGKVAVGEATVLELKKMPSFPDSVVCRFTLHAESLGRQYDDAIALRHGENRQWFLLLRMNRHP